MKKRVSRYAIDAFSVSVWECEQRHRIYLDQSGIVSQETGYARNGYKIVSIYFDGVIAMVVVIKPYRYRSFNSFVFLSLSLRVCAFMALKLQKVNVMASSSGIEQFNRNDTKINFYAHFTLAKWFNKPFNFLTSIR